MEMKSYEPGTPSWIDVGVPDIAAAADFYCSLFGWDAPEGDPQYGGYRVATLKGLPVAGLGPQQAPGPPYWTSYIAVADVDATVAAVEANGGQVLAPAMDIGDQGRMAVFMDPQGAAFAAWQGGLMPGAGLVNEAGALCWNELSARDEEAAKSFYSAVFGWTHATSTGGPFPYTEFQRNGTSIAGMMPMPEMVPAEVPSYWLVYFAVESCEDAVAKVSQLGGAVTVPPMDVPVGRFSVVTDPAGAMFAVIALSGEGMD